MRLGSGTLDLGQVARAAEAVRASRGVCLLLVEDDDVDRMAFERYVRKNGLEYDYHYAATLKEAEALLAEHVFDVIITDYHLGDGSGLDLLHRDLDIPVVVITGAGDEEIAVQAMRAGAYDYLVKDIDRRYLKMVQVTVEHARKHHASGRQAQVLAQALTSINDAIYITDMDGKLIFVNETFRKTYGFEEDVLDRPAADLWHSGSLHNLQPVDPADLPDLGERGECVHVRADGTTFGALVSRSPIYDSGGERVASVGAVRDISQRKRWEEALRESEERFSLAAAGANDGLWDWDLRTGKVYYSSRWRSTLGYSESQLEPTLSSWLDLVHEDDLELLRAQLDAHVGGKTPHFENEHRIRTSDGEYRWVQVRGLAVRDGRGAYRVAGSQRDVTDRKRMEDQLMHAALHDSLTGLPNRALFMDRLENAIGRAGRRNGHPFGVIFLDLDRFKMINDSLGHQAGDRLLQALSQRLQRCVRSGDTVARLGGDEFAILLEELEDSREVHQVADKIQVELQRPFEIDGQECFTGASLGIAFSATGYERAEDVLRDADIAMYQAKAEGRTRQVVFKPHMHTQAVKTLALENDLRRAVERDEFEVHYQPIVDLSSGALQGFEALVRWHHPERGLVMPGEFLPMAQETDLSATIGWQVLEKSCRQMRRWHETIFADHPEVGVSVNLDATQLESSELVDRVDTVLVTSGIDPHLLRLEITEGMIIVQPEMAAAILDRLRRKGIRLYIDDFGTGYSSLSQLKRFPVDTLKIDRSFVAQMLERDDDLEIVRTIVQLSRNLHLEVMAEGIETQAQLHRLRDLGCDFGQGFLFARGLPADAVAEMFRDGRALFSGFEAPQNLARSTREPHRAAG
ncbi:MAG: EAL domain-containing protein [Thermoanaerobaculia bacterium]|nr:EAL domain-containing protein [Thermoanaerobaculia bacterium]